MHAVDAQARLTGLLAERFEARSFGIEDASPYMTRLEEAIAEARIDYVAAAVAEIARLRRELASAMDG